MHASNSDEGIAATDKLATEADDLVIPSPIGALTLRAAGGALVAVDFCRGDGDFCGGDGDLRGGLGGCDGAPGGEGAAEAPAAPAASVDPVLRAAAEQFAAYVSGRLREFTVPIRPSGTPFQLAVWEVLRRIPYGETVPYGEVAARLGRPGAARAVGRATARNPLPVVVPCHRVIGSDGALTGYAGGLGVKRTLLALEAGSASRLRPSCGLPAHGV